MDQKDGKVLMCIRPCDFKWPAVLFRAGNVSRRPTALTASGHRDSGQNPTAKTKRASFVHGQPPEYSARRPVRDCPLAFTTLLSSFLFARKGVLNPVVAKDGAQRKV